MKTPHVFSFAHHMNFVFETILLFLIKSRNKNVQWIIHGTIKRMESICPCIVFSQASYLG
jgi:hypothetical protein